MAWVNVAKEDEVGNTEGKRQHNTKNLVYLLGLVHYRFFGSGFQTEMITES